MNTTIGNVTVSAGLENNLNRATLFFASVGLAICIGNTWYVGKAVKWREPRPLPILLLLAYVLWLFHQVLYLASLLVDYTHIQDFTIIIIKMDVANSACMAVSSLAYMIVSLKRFQISKSLRPYPDVYDKIALIATVIVFFGSGVGGVILTVMRLSRPSITSLASFIGAIKFIYTLILDCTLAVIFANLLIKAKLKVQGLQKDRGSVKSDNTANMSGKPLDILNNQKTVSILIRSLCSIAVFTWGGMITYVVSFAAFSQNKPMQDFLSSLSSICSCLLFTNSALYLVLIKTIFLKDKPEMKSSVIKK